MTIETRAEVVWERSNRFATQRSRTQKDFTVGWPGPRFGETPRSNLSASHNLIVGLDDDSLECRIRLRQNRDPLDGFERHVTAKRHVFAVLANPDDAIFHWTLRISHDSVSQVRLRDSVVVAQQPGPADVGATRRDRGSDASRA